MLRINDKASRIAAARRIAYFYGISIQREKANFYTLFFQIG